MRRVFPYAFLVIAALLTAAATMATQEVMDRIAARIDNDVILLSDVQDLSRYQLLVDGKSESDAQILDRLIDQWIVRHEAQIAQFPQPTEAEVNHAVDRLKQSFSSPQEYEIARLKAELTDADIRKMTTSQLYLSDYLDSRFRPFAQISDKDTENFYQNAVLPKAKERGQKPPTLDAARNVIQEALTQDAINKQADIWLKESRARLHIEKFLGEQEK